MTRDRLTFRFRLSLLILMAGLVVSGLTALPLRWEANVLAGMLGIESGVDYQTLSGLDRWIAYVRQGLDDSYGAYPFLAYGTDWLAFAHLVIAVFFIGPLMRPTAHDWILVSGLIACALVIPLALICGAIRGIPVYWRLIDCSFGLFGAIPLAYCLVLSRELKACEREVYAKGSQE